MPRPKRQGWPSKLFEMIFSGLSIVTPPSASTRSRKPEKSTSTTWLIGMPVSACTVRIASAGPPVS